jgi:hypothetical protein
MHTAYIELSSNFGRAVTLLFCIFRTCPDRVSGRTPGVLTDVFAGFLSLTQTNSRTVFGLSHVQIVSKIRVRVY